MNRQIFSIILMTALFAAVYSSCDTLVRTDEAPEGQIAVNLNAGIKPVSTYVSNDQWETSDEVGLYMKRTGQALTDFGAIYGGVGNVQMSIVGQTVTSDPPVMYPTVGNVDFVAYYPYTKTVSSDLTIPVNVDGQVAGLPVEILYSNNITNQTPTVSPVQLDFNYSLAKIELTVTGGVNSNLNLTDFSTTTVTIEDLYTQAKLQLVDGTFTDFQGKHPVKLYRSSVNDTTATFEALVLPTNEAVTFLFDVGGFVYRHTMQANYASDTLYRYDFALDFPFFPEGNATLLNAVIIPRGEATQQNISINAGKQMTMTTEASAVTLGFEGTGKVTIDWGDGTSESYTLRDNISIFKYSYPSTLARTITITGENVTFLLCDNNQLTGLNVSKNDALTSLSVKNNLLTAPALDALFGTLNKNMLGKTQTIYIFNNPGTDACDRYIAQSKGWTVLYEYYQGDSGYVKFHYSNPFSDSLYIGSMEIGYDTIFVVKKGGDQFFLEKIDSTRYLIKYGDKYVVPAIPDIVPGLSMNNLFKLTAVSATRSGDYLSVDNLTWVNLKNPNNFTYTFACHEIYDGKPSYTIYSELIFSDAAMGITASNFIVLVEAIDVSLFVVAETSLSFSATKDSFTIE